MEQNLILSPQQIDIWQGSLSSIPLSALALLNPEEQARARRFHFAKHQRRFIVARALMRTILGRYLDEDPKRLIFAYNKHGKPELEHFAEIHFNLSHSGEFFLLAVGQKFPLGIDLEQHSERPYEGLSQANFSQEEHARLMQAPLESRAAVFFVIWSQKEAFMKACGMGLAYPLAFTVPDMLVFDLKAPDLNAPDLNAPLAYARGSDTRDSGPDASVRSARIRAARVSKRYFYPGYFYPEYFYPEYFYPEYFYPEYFYPKHHPKYLYDPIEDKQWQFYTFQPAPNYSAALCYHPHTKLKHIKGDANDLLWEKT